MRLPLLTKTDMRFLERGGNNKGIFLRELFLPCFLFVEIIYSENGSKIRIMLSYFVDPRLREGTMHI